MRLAIVIVPGFGRLSGWEDEYNRCLSRMNDAIANGDLPPTARVVRLPRRLDIGPRYDDSTSYFPSKWSAIIPNRKYYKSYHPSLY